jgi:hypothetical protein
VGDKLCLNSSDASPSSLRISSSILPSNILSPNSHLHASMAVCYSNLLWTLNKNGKNWQKVCQTNKSQPWNPLAIHSRSSLRSFLLHTLKRSRLSFDWLYRSLHLMQSVSRLIDWRIFTRRFSTSNNTKWQPQRQWKLDAWSHLANAQWFVGLQIW